MPANPTGCCSMDIVTECCAPDPVPSTLFATVTADETLACMDGLVIELTYNPATGQWEGDIDFNGDCNLALVMACGTSVAGHWAMSGVVSGVCSCIESYPGFEDPAEVPVSCDPVLIVFNDALVTITVRE